MGTTVIGVGNPLAVKRWSASLAVDVPKNSYFSKKFTSRSATPNAPIQEKTDLEQEAGDTISFDLSMQLRQRPTEGDNKLEGKQENLKFYTDVVAIDQMRSAASSGGKMTRKRTVHDLRTIAKARLSEWWGQVIDELHFIYLSGARGVNAEYILPTDYTGFAGNPLQAPDAAHIMYAGDATSKATISSDDTMSRIMIERAKTRATMIKAVDNNSVRIQPIKIDGESHYVVVMNAWQQYSLRTSTTTNDWMDIQKAAAAAEGRNNPIFKGSMGMINDVVLHEHEGVVRFSDYGADTLQPAARALFLGAQAGVVAYGNAGGGMRYEWHEEMLDLGNELVVASNCVFGLKKTRFNGRDFGTIALDTYAKDPQ